MHALEVCLLVLLLPARVFAAPPSLFVDAELSELTDALAIELPETTLVRDQKDAEIRVHLSLEQRLTIVDQSGTVIVDRTLTGTRDAAVRAALLLIVEAVKTWEPTSEAPPVESSPPAAVERTEPVPEASVPWIFGAAPGFGVAWRWGSTRPQLLYSLALSIAHADLEASIVGSASGFGCCDVSSEAIEGEPTSIAILLQGRITVLRPVEAIELALSAALGFQHESMSAKAIGGFAGPGITEHPSFDGPIARAGLTFGVRGFDPFTLRLDAGAQLEPSVEVALPDYPEYVGVQGRSIARMPISPYLLMSFGYAGF